MSQEKSFDQTDKTEKKQNFNIKANTLITCLFGLIITGIGVINHLQVEASHSDTINAVKDLKIEFSSSYITKSDFQVTVNMLNATDGKLWEKQAETSAFTSKSINEINMKLQHIEDSLPIQAKKTY